MENEDVLLENVRNQVENTTGGKRSSPRQKTHEALWNFTKDTIRQYYVVGEEGFAKHTSNLLTPIGR